MGPTVAAVVSAMFALALLTSQSAFAGPYTDELSRCLVRSTTDADKTHLVRWMFAAVSLHPAIRSIVSVSDSQRDELNKNAAAVVEKLLTESCRSATREALKHEGVNTFQESFQVLGEVAGRQLFSDPAVARSIGDFTSHLDAQKLNRALRPD